jgi:hypothetical protein
MAKGDWTRKSIEDERARDAAREELEHGFKGAMSDGGMARYAKALRLVHGPAPEPGWDCHESNT